MRNLLCRVPKSARLAVATLVHDVRAGADAGQVREQHARCVAQIGERFAETAEQLDDAVPGIIAYAELLREVWRRVWSNNAWSA